MLELKDIKVGEEYEVISGSCSTLTTGVSTNVVGSIIRIDEIVSEYLEYTKVGFLPNCPEGDNRIGMSCSCCLKPENLRRISSSNTNNNKTFMSTIIDKIKLATKTEPNKSFIKAGITDMNDNLTTEGRDAFLNYLLGKFGSDFNKDVVSLLVEEK